MSHCVQIELNTTAGPVLHPLLPAYLRKLAPGMILFAARRLAIGRLTAVGSSSLRLMTPLRVCDRRSALKNPPDFLLQSHVLFQIRILGLRFVHGTCRVLKCHVADTSEPVPDPASAAQRAGPDCGSRSQPRQRKARRITESGPSGNGILNYDLSQPEALTSCEGSFPLDSGSQAPDSQVDNR